MDRRRLLLRRLGWALIALGAAVMAWGAFQAQRAVIPAGSQRDMPIPSPTPSGTPTETLTPTPEPLIPTPTPTGMATNTPRPSDTPSLTPVSSATPTTEAPELKPSVASATPKATPSSVDATGADPTATATTAPTVTASPPTSFPTATPTSAPVPAIDSGGFRVPPAERFRLGVSLPSWQGNPEILRALQVGWVMDWHARSGNPYGGDVDYAKTVRMSGGRLSLDAGTLTAIAAGSPGSLWMIANEPDVRWQDNVTADVYARLYHEAYHAIKAGDPSAVVAAGGIAQPTPLRLAYLDQVLSHYQSTYGTALPADGWHIHNYMLREERNSWGVDIPPGITEDTGVLYGISDSGNLEAFKAQIVDFRRWMLARGYGGQPLVISEFGIPMPADYGFSADVVAEFMRETTRYLLTAENAGLGNPADRGRLVQRWCWFSIEYPVYPTGDLLDTRTNTWTALGHAWLAIVKE